MLIKTSASLQLYARTLTPESTRSPIKPLSIPGIISDTMRFDSLTRFVCDAKYWHELMHATAQLSHIRMRSRFVFLLKNQIALALSECDSHNKPL